MADSRGTSPFYNPFGSELAEKIEQQKMLDMVAEQFSKGEKRPGGRTAHDPKSHQFSPTIDEKIFRWLLDFRDGKMGTSYTPQPKAANDLSVLPIIEEALASGDMQGLGPDKPGRGLGGLKSGDYGSRGR